MSVPFHLHKNEKTARIEKLSLFRDCSHRELAAVADVLVEEEVAAGGVLTREGQDGGTAYIIVEGRAEVVREDHTLATLGPDEIVGELSLLDRQPRTATVKAVTDLKVLAFSHTDFAKLVTTVPELSQGLLSVLAKRVRDLDSKVVTGL
ncbi:MAG: cyclic nucleotide-binding domain-containing protein [Actinomycetota bacterium]|nr:cyclic nucleotide-binding domain-containing protein [Actinomycetota bacterium]